MMTASDIKEEVVYSLIGAALDLLTDDAESQETLKTSLGTLTRVLDAVNWAKISKGNPDAWFMVKSYTDTAAREGITPQLAADAITGAWK